MVNYLTFDEGGITLEDRELVHLGLGQLNDRVIMVLGILDGELVWCLLLFKNGC